MGRMADLDAEHVTDLHSYSVGFDTASKVTKEKIIEWVLENKTEIADSDYVKSDTLIEWIQNLYR